MEQNNNRNTESDSTTKGYGPQGVDKAPGEETVQNTAPFVQESQKGKTNDGDPANEEDQPVSQQDL